MKDDIKHAIEKILSRPWTYQTASSITMIPIGTLASLLARKSNNLVGRPTALTIHE